MGQIDILRSEASYLELVLKNKEKTLKRAMRLIERAEEEVQDALNAILERAEVDQRVIVGAPRLLRGVDGRPARIVWRDAHAASSGTVGGEEVTPPS